MNNLKKLSRYHHYIILLLLLILSAGGFIFFFLNGHNLYYGDAQSRLNISRKIIDNLTPGLPQVGNVWLPLPQLFMLPFIWNDYMWRSGAAGAIMSMAAYVVGGVYLYKTVNIYTASLKASLFAVAVYGLNINALYFQTTAMSEMLFICMLIIAIYHFSLWIKNENNILNLIFAGIAVSATTLIRYEGLALLFSSIPMVAFCLYVKKRNYKKVEGRTILYTTVAVLGFLLWTIYLTAIFGDPLYWKNVYLSEKIRESDGGQISGYTFNLTLWSATWKYLTAVVWMNGLIPTVLATIALPVLASRSIKDRSYYFLPALLSLSIFVFMILTLQRNTPIGQPELNINSISSSKTSYVTEFNIRYGLLVLPMVAILCAYLFAVRSVVLKAILILLMSVQIYSYIKPVYTVIYQMPLHVADKMSKGASKKNEMTHWMIKNYDGGYIMISALKNDPQMLQMGLPYRTFIHEGTGKYWKESQKNPQRYAKWIIFNKNNEYDQVTKYLKGSPILRSYYRMVFDNKGMVIYKIKTKTERQID